MFWFDRRPEKWNLSLVPQRKSYPISVQVLGALMIWRETLAELRQMLCPPTHNQSPRPRRWFGLRRVARRDERRSFWQNLVSAAESSPVRDIADAEPVRQLVRLSAGEVVELKLAVRNEQRANDHVDQETTAFFRFEDTAGPIGFLALEQFGEDALLHWLFVLEHRRGAGAATEMASHAIEAAVALGVSRIWLLTATTAPFFENLGFRQVDQSAVPESLARSRAFRSASQRGAICMAVDLPPS